MATSQVWHGTRKCAINGAKIPKAQQIAGQPCPFCANIIGAYIEAPGSTRSAIEDRDRDGSGARTQELMEQDPALSWHQAWRMAEDEQGRISRTESGVGAAPAPSGERQPTDLELPRDDGLITDEEMEQRSDALIEEPVRAVEPASFASAASPHPSPPRPTPAQDDEGRLSFSKVLFGTREDGVEPDHDAAPEGVDKLLDGLSLALQGAARREIVRSLRDVLGSSIFVVVEDGWGKHGELVKAANRTVDEAGSMETIEVADHRITAGYEPKVEVLVDGVPVGSVEFRLTVSAHVASVIAVITAGRLVALRSGNVEFSAALLAEGYELARGSRRADLVAEMPLGNGIQLASR